MNGSRKIRSGALLGGALATVVLLAGCTSTSNESIDAEPTTFLSSAVPETSPTAEAQLQVGDILTQKPEQLRDGLTAYKLADTRYAVIDPTQPLPDVVRADVQSRVDSQIQDPGTPDAVGTNRSTIIDTAQQMASLAGLQSGKSVVVIFPLVGSCTSDEQAYLGWAHTSLQGANEGCKVLRSLEESRAEVDAAVTATGEGERYEVFIHMN